MKKRERWWEGARGQEGRRSKILNRPRKWRR